ncbi:ATP-binding protein [Erysipelothrix larvae]|uniref:ATP-binding protein n=1 Tax=Erysipelothrix larvae TaxID=1514105 RepID=A0A120JTW8_9FIRM|nr:IS21-like element helper ATPase IstB [Erysipelothrix larvae]AMC92683.1 ATP-binding protein [Erysipelothrix larvae]AMC92966.1 ATP-binding protein [Erysipelothrix larvae]AMC93086.1 ATP-binding protein [Erysipelothrix larvae]AMC93677.1 ATP-binding protein [Erysipelothrix larvae]AMC94004.1 ATP-binding protein [Erysipelothrix larvae]
METIEQLSKELKLSFIKTHYEAAIQEAKHKGLDFQEFLNELLYCERNNRRDNGIKQRIRAARFPQNKTLEDFTTVKFNSELKRKFKELETLNFIENKENIILMSNPGMGKTHYATALGIKACLENKKVLFISVPNLIIELKEAMSKNQITQYKKKFEKFDLVILDELGYVSFDKEGSEILFNLISNRITVGSMIITTNLMFDRWEEIFKDPILTTALVDRLTYKSHLLNMSGESYRVEETIAWLKSKE